MANKILLRKSSVANRVPITTDLDYGELAINYADGKLYFKDSSNVIKYFQSGAGASSVVISDTPPASPSNGMPWWDSTQGRLFVYYDDGTSTQWVDASPAVSGPQGPAGSIAVGTVTTGTAGSSVVIENVGNIYSAVLNFTIPRGDTGPQGPVWTGGQLGTGTFTKASASITAGNIAFDNGTTNSSGLHFYIANSTNFGIDATSSGLRFVYKLDETGEVVLGNFDSTGNFLATANVTAYSDETLKTNWRNLPEDFVAELAKVKAGTYDRLDIADVTQDGVSAQSLRALLPNSVCEDEHGILSVAYGNAALVSAVKLAEKSQQQDERIAKLEELILKQQAQINALKDLIHD